MAGFRVEALEVPAGSILVVDAEGPVAVALLQELVGGAGLSSVLPILY